MKSRLISKEIFSKANEHSATLVLGTCKNYRTIPNFLDPHNLPAEVVLMNFFDLDKNREPCSKKFKFQKGWLAAVF
jgi:hypothetical protein